MTINKAKNILFNYIKEKNLRYTKQREEILEAYLNADKHITVEELKLMRECGLAEEIKVDSKTRFEQDFGRKHHDHLICIKCGEFIEVKDEKIEHLQNKLAEMNDFTPKWHKLEIYGLCAKCK
ncbi:MAG: transcriptional repressor [Armatimonadetes bacterium]|nr:transcriptional repressor [Armatimonadota bacterium]